MANKGKKIKTSEIQYGWCEAEEGWLPMTECSGCIHHFRQDGMTIWCSWSPTEKPCEGCGIPAEYCEPGSCQIAQVIKKAAD